MGEKRKPKQAATRTSTASAAQSSTPRIPPARAIAANQPVDREMDEPQSDEDHRDGERQPFVDVLQHIVAHLVADDEQNLMGRQIADGVVPDHDALGGADAGDVRIQSGDFFAGSHQKHARGRNIQSGVLGETLQLGCQLGITLLQRGKVIEHGVDPHWRDEDAENDDGDGAQPEPEPPFSRRAPDDPEQQQQQRREYQ